ncbi:MAG: hypothetical protein R6U63_01825 [Longimicrobiales bacterium]
MTRIFPALIAVVLAGCGTDVTGPSSSLLSCVFGDPVHSEVGEVLQVRGTGHDAMCLAGDGSTEYLYVPFWATADTSRQLNLGLTGAGVGDVADAADFGVVSIDVADPTLALFDRRRRVRDYAFHDRLRAREIEELGPMIRAGAAPAAALAPVATPDVPAVGEMRDFNVAISCTETDIRTGEVMDVSDHAVVYADTGNPADLTPDDYRYFGLTFDTLVHRVETAYFGEPTDIDGNGRAILFFTRAVNERNPRGAEAVTIGFFWSGDLFPENATDRLQACPASNHSEMFYLIAPDPTGEAGAAFTLDDVRHLAIPLIGHEFQHLINASRRLFVNNADTFEAPWLNEGLSHVAEELLYFDVARLQTGRNLNIDSVRNARAPADTFFNRYMGANFNNFAKYLSRPDTASLMGEANDLSTRGAVWNFLRYAADRSALSDTAFFFDLVNGTGAGVSNLNTVLGGDDAFDWMRDWTVSVFADDRVEGLEPRFRSETWNLRSIYEGSTLNRFPLRVSTLGNGESTTVDLLAGGATFNRFGVRADGRAALHVEAGGRAPPSTLRGSFLRIR